MRYTYHGDRLTDDSLRGAQLDPVRRENGKCRRGRNGNMLVCDADGRRYVVLARLLRVNEGERA